MLEREVVGRFTYLTHGTYFQLDTRSATRLRPRFVQETTRKPISCPPDEASGCALCPPVTNGHSTHPSDTHRGRPTSSPSSAGRTIESQRPCLAAPDYEGHVPAEVRT